MNGLETRIAKLESAPNNASLVVLITSYAKGELLGYREFGGRSRYIERNPGESESDFVKRANAQADAWGGYVALGECRGSAAR